MNLRKTNSKKIDKKPSKHQNHLSFLPEAIEIQLKESFIIHEKLKINQSECIFSLRLAGVKYQLGEGSNLSPFFEHKDVIDEDEFRQIFFAFKEYQKIEDTDDLFKILSNGDPDGISQQSLQEIIQIYNLDFREEDFHQIFGNQKEMVSRTQFRKKLNLCRAAFEGVEFI